MDSSTYTVYDILYESYSMSPYISVNLYGPYNMVHIVCEDFPSNEIVILMTLICRISKPTEAIKIDPRDNEKAPFLLDE